MDFRILIVDDDPAQIDNAIGLIEGNSIVDAPCSIICDSCNSYSDALDKIKHTRFDIVILDLRDDSKEGEQQEHFEGEKLFSQIKENIFVPIVFYSGYAHKVQQYAGTFIKAVVKGEVQQLRTAIKEILDTKFPQFMSHIDNQLRSYLWTEHEQICKDYSEISNNEMIFLIGRRLANGLKSDVIKNFLNIGLDQSIQPIEMYVWPPIAGGANFFGDILKLNNEDRYFVLLNPSCDLVQCNADNMILSECLSIEKFSQYQTITTHKTNGTTPSKTEQVKLKDLLFKNDRYYYLPKTNFINHLIVDFQYLHSEDITNLTSMYTKIASLDSPFAESLQDKFSRYSSRIGTPDLDKEKVIAKMIA